MNETNKILPGETVRFAGACSSGSSEDSYGIGRLLLDLHRPGHKYPWLDLGCLYFANPSTGQLEDMETAPSMTEGNKAWINYHRRLSKKQAEFLQQKICQFLMAEFQGVIPSDDEIDQLYLQKLKNIPDIEREYVNVWETPSS